MATGPVWKLASWVAGPPPAGTLLIEPSGASEKYTFAPWTVKSVTAVIGPLGPSRVKIVVGTEGGSGRMHETPHVGGPCTGVAVTPAGQGWHWPAMQRPIASPSR